MLFSLLGDMVVLLGLMAHNALFGGGGRKPVGMIISLLVHVLLLWLILTHTSVIKKVKEGDEGILTMLTAPVATPDKSNPAKAEPAKKVPKKPPQTVISKDALPIIIPERVAEEPAPRPPTKSEPIVEPPVDMSAMVEAARKLRNQNRDPGESEETEAQRADRIARANIAKAGSRGRDSEDAGGVFEVRHVGVSSGEFFFRGWSTSRGRTAAQMINVYTAGEEDVQVAIVKKMIAIIRAEKADEFTWESHRLGRSIIMSARPEREPELIAFLLKELFPNYIPTKRK
jgi:hypothetical protein